MTSTTFSGRSVALEIAEFVSALRYEDLSEAAILAAQDALLDQVAIMLMGSTLALTRPVIDVLLGVSGAAEATVVGYGTKASALHAAMINATFGHSCEIDDTGYGGGPHPGSLTVPAALAIAEKTGASGRDVVLAVVVGYELLSRLSRAMPNMGTIGFHPHSVLGPFGVAVTSAKVLGLSADQIVHALAIAGSHSSGTEEYDQVGGEVKRYHSAMAVHGGIMGTLLAQRGLTGPPTIFEGLRGIARLFAGVTDLSIVVNGLSSIDDFAITRRAMKYYPALGGLHTTIQATTCLVVEHGLMPSDVMAIDVWVRPLTIKHGGSIYQPTDVLSAQFSLPFSVGLAVVRRSNVLADYLDASAWRDPEILAVAQRVRIHADEAFAGYRRQGARVRITRRDGYNFEAEEPYRKGMPQLPISEEEFINKVRSLAQAQLAPQEVEALIVAARQLHTMETIDPFVQLLTPTNPRA